MYAGRPAPSYVGSGVGVPHSEVADISRPARSYGDSEGDGEASPSAFFLVDAVTRSCVVVAVLEIAAVSFFCAQEVTNAMPIKAVIKDKIDFFIGFGYNCEFE